MSINEIRESGLLELYILGMLEGAEQRTVETALKDFPELKADINTIERALQSYAFAYAVNPSPTLKQQILSEVRKTNNSSDSNLTKQLQKENKPNYLLYGLLGLLGLLMAYFAYSWFNANKEIEALQLQIESDNEVCDSIREASSQQYALYQDLTNPDNDILVNAVQEKYPDTEIYFYHNPVNKKNYLQLASLPAIDNNTQSYQLWSIKGDDPPRPLDVFQSDGEDLIPVAHVEGTAVYAITIEQKGGVQSPTLDNLIGTFAI